jgi:hypothetical protein
MHLTVTPKGLRLDPANPLGQLLELMAPATAEFAAPSVSRPSDDVDPCVEAAASIFAAAKALSPNHRATLKAWADIPGKKVTVLAMADDAPWRLSVAAQVQAYTSDLPEVVESGEA